MSQDSRNVVNVDGRDRRPWALISKTKLLDAAVAEIAERGYDRARLVDIAARADLTVGAIYNWYANKTELFNAALEHSINKQHEANSVFLSTEGALKKTGYASSHWLLLIAALAPGPNDLKGPTDAQKMLLEALKAAWRDEDSQDAIQSQLASLLIQYEIIIARAIADGMIDESLDAKLLARLFMAFPVGLSLLTLAGFPDVENAKFIPFFQRFDAAIKPRP